MSLLISNQSAPPLVRNDSFPIFVHAPSHAPSAFQTNQSAPPLVRNDSFPIFVHAPSAFQTNQSAPPLVRNDSFPIFVHAPSAFQTNQSAPLQEVPDLFSSATGPVPRSKALSKVHNSPPIYEGYKTNRIGFVLLLFHDFNSPAVQEGLSQTERIRYTVLDWIKNPYKTNGVPFSCSRRLAHGYFSAFRKKDFQGLKDDQIMPWIRILEEWKAHFKALKPDMSKSCLRKWNVINLWQRDIKVKTIKSLFPDQKPKINTIISLFKKYGINYLNRGNKEGSSISRNKREYQGGNLSVSCESNSLEPTVITIKRRKMG